MTDLLQTLKQLTTPGGIEGVFAVKYAEFAQNTPAMRDEYRRLAGQIATAVQAGKVLEIGPGPGFIAIEIARLLPQVHVIGLDLSAKMIEIATGSAQEHGVAERVEFRQGDASAIPFEDESFDFVVSSGSLYHWAQPTQIFKEIHRVLKPGRRALVGDLRADAPAQDVQAFADQIHSRFMRWGLRHSFREGYTVAEVEGLVQGIPFACVRIDVEGISLTIWLEKRGGGHAAIGQRG